MDRKLLTVQMASGFGGGGRPGQGSSPRGGAGGMGTSRELDFSLSSIGSNVGSPRGGGWQQRSAVQGDGGLSPYPVGVTNHLLSIGAASPRASPRGNARKQPLPFIFAPDVD